MDDLISRAAVIDALDAICERECEYSKPQRAVMCGACRLGSAFDVIDELPSAERKKGRWELAEDGWYCSSCELYPPFDCDPEEKGIPYCPNCGAEMRGEEDV